MLHGPIPCDDMQWSVTFHPMDAIVTIVCYAICIMCKCGNYMNGDGGFGGKACFGDFML